MLTRRLSSAVDANTVGICSEELLLGGRTSILLMYLSDQGKDLVVSGVSVSVALRGKPKMQSSTSLSHEL